MELTAGDAPEEEEEEEEAVQHASTLALLSHWADVITTHRDFEALIMVIIAGTVVTLALYDPLQGDMEGRNGVLYWLSECGGTGASLGSLHSPEARSLGQSNTQHSAWVGSNAP